MGLFIEKASHHAGCFEFVDVNKIGRQRMTTGFVKKKVLLPCYIGRRT
nr:MAG TPA: hypothetical protein [Caudoviricetes sp.]